MNRTLTLCVVFALCIAAAAQDKPAGKKPSAKPAAQSGGMPMPKPSPEMTKLLAAFNGNWTGTMTSEAVMGMPASTSSGPARFHAGPGRLSLIEDVVTTDEHGGKFAGHGVIWWDAKAKGYKAIWCDNGTPTGCADGGTGNWDGDKLVFNGTFDMMGKQYNMKETYSGFSPAGFTFVMEGGEGSGPQQKMFTVEYKKAEGKAAAPAK